MVSLEHGAGSQERTAFRGIEPETLEEDVDPRRSRQGGRGALMGLQLPALSIILPYDPGGTEQQIDQRFQNAGIDDRPQSDPRGQGEKDRMLGPAHFAFDHALES